MTEKSGAAQATPNEAMLSARLDVVRQQRNDALAALEVQQARGKLQEDLIAALVQQAKVDAQRIADLESQLTPPAGDPEPVTH